MEAKPFSIGFRIEHPQGLIDRARLGRHAGHPLLGAADYKLVHHASNGRSVYSFCMCPGGTVVAATSRAGPRRHQRHEPVLAQRAQRQRRHRGGHRAARLPGLEPGRPRWPASRCSASWNRTPSCSAAATTARRPAGRRLHRRQAVDRARQRRALVQAGRDAGRPARRPARLRHRGDARSLAGVRPQDQGLRPARRGADRRRDAHLVAAADHARRATARA